ncbi:MAG: hypothetical protein WEB03_00550 [Nitriliruptor sp.]|uniref:hypothetical protein n=1 Tax=Nitriliruptor sp. TaxID=2448056 RepID=UPI0034A02DAE
MRSDTASGDHLRLAKRASGLLVVLTVPIVVAAGLYASVSGVVGSLVGVSFVALLFGASSASLVWAIDHAPGLAVAVMAGGAFARLAIYAAVLVSLSHATWLHRPSLAMATVVATTVMLAAEMVWIARTPRLFHVDAGAARPTAHAHPSPLASGAPTPDAMPQNGSRSL